MRKIKILLLAFIAFISSTSSHAEHVRVTNPNALSVEMFGMGFLYGLRFDRVLNDDLVAGIGMGSVPLKYKDTDEDSNKSALLAPVYASYYFMRNGNSPFVLVGASLVTNSSDTKNMSAKLGGIELNSSPIIGMAGLGYESRSDAGFLFRLTGYLMAAKSLIPWFGFSFGYAF